MNPYFKYHIGQGDWVKRVFNGREWGRGKVRRMNEDCSMALCEWKHTPICTWVFVGQLERTRAAKRIRLETLNA